MEITRRGAAVARLVRAPREPSDGLNLSSFLAATTDRPLQGWQRFQELRQQRLQVLTLNATDFDAAARLCLTGSAALRAGDALHLAVCQRHRSTLVSFDQVLCAAAAQHRLEVALLRIEA